MLVQAQVVRWWGTGRPAEFHPVTGIAYRQEDRRVRLQNRVVSTTACRATRTLSRNENFEFFWCPLPWGSECSGNYQPRGNGKTARESARQIPACSRLSQEPKARWRPGSADPTAPEQVWQTPGLRELRSECEQILPPAGNRKPASDQAHRIQPAQCSSRRRPCRGRERGDRQSSVPPDPTPSQAQPTGRRIAGYDYKTEAIQRPRADSYARSREMTKAVYVVSGNYQMRREYPPERHEGGRRSS